jgi:DNA repair protein RadC
MLTFVPSCGTSDTAGAGSGRGGGGTGFGGDMPDEVSLAELFAPYFAGLSLELAIAAGFDQRGCLVTFAAGYGDKDGNGALIRLVRTTLQPVSVSTIVIAHNHPDGDPRPSASDIAATRRVSALCRLANADLADHLLFTHRNIASFRSLGLL